MTRKFSIIIVYTIFRDNNQFIVNFLPILIILFLLLHILNKPYKDNFFNELETLSLITCFVTYYSLIYYIRIISDSLKLFFLVLISIVNLLFLLVWMKAYVSVIRKKAALLMSNLNRSLSVLKKFYISSSIKNKKSLQMILTVQCKFFKNFEFIFYLGKDKKEDKK